MLEVKVELQVELEAEFRGGVAAAADAFPMTQSAAFPISCCCAFRA